MSPTCDKFMLTFCSSVWCLSQGVNDLVLWQQWVSLVANERFPIHYISWQEEAPAYWFQLPLPTLTYFGETEMSLGLVGSGVWIPWCIAVQWRESRIVSGQSRECHFLHGQLTNLEVVWKSQQFLNCRCCRLEREVVEVGVYFLCCRQLSIRSLAVYQFCH